MLTVRAAFLACITLGCAVAGAQERDPAEVAAKLKDELTRDFKDPAAAQFRNLFVSAKSEVYTLCGEVNGKNSYGAYIGFRRFAIVGSAPRGQPLEAVKSMKHITSPKNDYGLMDQMWASLCANKVADVQ